MMGCDRIELGLCWGSIEYSWIRESKGEVAVSVRDAWRNERVE